MLRSRYERGVDRHNVALWNELVEGEKLDLRAPGRITPEFEMLLSKLRFYPKFFQLSVFRAVVSHHAAPQAKKNAGRRAADFPRSHDPDSLAVHVESRKSCPPPTITSVSR